MFIKKIKIILSISIIFWCFGLPLLPQTEEKKILPSKMSSLIRIDLLPQAKKIPPAVHRNIFSPQIFSASGSVASLEKKEPIGERREINSKEEKEKTANQSDYFLSFRYIGYVHSAHKTIALIIVNGLAMAVEEGEYVLPDFKVVKIRPEEIIIAGPDKGEIRFSLEGERDEKI